MLKTSFALVKGRLIELLKYLAFIRPETQQAAGPHKQKNGGATRCAYVPKVA